MNSDWTGVFPAVTTKFHADESLDMGEMEKNFRAQVDAGVDGLIVCGSLGEASTLEPDEKLEIAALAQKVSGGRVPVLLTVSERRTRTACDVAARAEAQGLDGLMVLPGMQYVSDARETMAHLRAVADASKLPIMVYNNPVAYKVDVSVEMFAELAENERFVAIKESSDDVRRVTRIINAMGDRYRIFCGVDNLALEALMMGADGWVAGLVDAFPEETVAIYQLYKAGRIEEAREIYRWFVPLLELDVSTRLVQNIKLAEAKVGLGTEHVRAPRLPLVGEERAHVEAVIDAALKRRPSLPKLAA